MAEVDASQLVCNNCDYQGLYADDDGHFYCTNCNSQAEDLIDRANADEDFLEKGDRGGGGIYSAAHKRTAPLFSSMDTHLDHVGPTEPADFGRTPRGVIFKEEDYYNTIRMRYVLGLQLMIQLQCEALVQKCGVTPLICGIAASIWLRFVASTRVFDDAWADQTVLESEKGEKRHHVGNKFVNEPRNLHNERLVVIWCRSLKKTIPLSYSLAVSFLACHVAREPVLPTDITKWAIEGKLPFFGAYPKIAESILEIERYNQHVSAICPIKASFMFRPQQLSTQKLESVAASIARSLGLSLPPVNFYQIACRYLKQLSLSVEKIIPYACRIQEWSMPPELWLSASEERLPTRVCVMSILIVAIRILYNINGFGKWETTLSAAIGSYSMDDHEAKFDTSNAKKGVEDMSGEPGSSSSSVHKYESESTQLLRNLEKRYEDLSDKFEYTKDLPTYLRYCKDVVFAGLEPLYRDPTLIEELWNFYTKNQEVSQDVKISEEFEGGSVLKRSRDYDIFNTPSNDSKKHRDAEIISSLSTGIRTQFHNYSPKWESDADITHLSSQPNKGPDTPYKVETSSQILEDIAIKYLKIDMEEHRFCYIPPRTEIKRHDYLHYVRKKGDGSLDYVAHADYYVLLRACAKVAQVDIRIMHVGVLSLERRLDWIEKGIDHKLVGKYSDVTVEDVDDLDDDSVTLSNLNL